MNKKRPPIEAYRAVQFLDRVIQVNDDATPQELTQAIAELQDVEDELWRHYQFTKQDPNRKRGRERAGSIWGLLFYVSGLQTILEDHPQHPVRSIPAEQENDPEDLTAFLEELEEIERETVNEVVRMLEEEKTASYDWIFETQEEMADKALQLLEDTTDHEEPTP